MKNANQLKMANGWMKNVFGWFKELDENYAGIREEFAKNVGYKLGGDSMKFGNLVLERLIQKWMKEGVQIF